MIGHGATLSGSTSGTIGKITNIDWSGVTVDDVEKTDFDSEDMYREFEPGLKDPGTMTADLRFQKALFNTVLATLEGNASGLVQAELWTMTVRTGSQLVGHGYLKRAGLNVPMGDHIMIPIEIRFTGKLSFPSSSSSSSSSSS